MKIIFPRKNNQHYWDIHYKYILNIIEPYCEIEYTDGLDNTNNSFYVIVDGKKVLFDFSDSGEGTNHSDTIIFKTHYKKHHEELDNIRPFLPVCFYDWNDINIDITYRAKGNTILNCQKAYGNAIKRRNDIKTKLINYDVDYSISTQKEYWEKINNCLVSLHVPGQNNNMLDRAQLQLMFFGCCTISPNLPEILPYNKKLIPNEHYLVCKDDYSDVINIIDWCKNNREKCIEIGNNAKTFMKDFTTKRIFDWIKNG